MVNKDILIENAKEYFNNAMKAKVNNEFNTAVTLFFKTISALCDYAILINKNFLPSSHTNRFRVLEKEFPDFYRIIDKDF